MGNKYKEKRCVPAKNGEIKGEKSTYEMGRANCLKVELYPEKTMQR